jgi:hypothetical protein
VVNHLEHVDLREFQGTFGGIADTFVETVYAGLNGSMPLMRQLPSWRFERVYAVDEAATELEVGTVHLFLFVCEHAT